MLRSSPLLVVVVLLVAQSSSEVAARARQAHDIGGSYYCDGTDVSGRRYRGTVSIGKHGDVYYLEWKFGSRRAAVGIGIRTGDVLAVSYYGESQGVIAYVIDDTRLEGRWTAAGTPGRLLFENLTRIPDPQDDGTQEPVDTTGVSI